MQQKRIRQYLFLAGEQACGKTYRAKNFIRQASMKPRITSVFVCDTTGEYSEVGMVFTSVESWLEREDGIIPRVCVFQLGVEVSAYDWVFDEACWQGEVLLVVDEAQEFCPNGPRFTGSKTLRRIITGGRHLERHDGQKTKVHLLFVTQYPKSCHQSLWARASKIQVGILLGEYNKAWVKGNFGNAAWSRVEKCRMYQFVTLRTPTKIKKAA